MQRLSKLLETRLDVWLGLRLVATAYAVLENGMNNQLGAVALDDGGSLGMAVHMHEIGTLP